MILVGIPFQPDCLLGTGGGVFSPIDQNLISMLKFYVSGPLWAKSVTHDKSYLLVVPYLVSSIQWAIPEKNSSGGISRFLTYYPLKFETSFTPGNSTKLCHTLLGNSKAIREHQQKTFVNTKIPQNS